MTTITCAWCAAAMGTKPGPDGVSHSVCQPCTEKAWDDYLARCAYEDRIAEGERGTSPGRGLVELARWTIHDTNRPTRAEER